MKKYLLISLLFIHMMCMGCSKKNSTSPTPPGNSFPYPEGLSTQTIQVNNLSRKFLVYRPVGLTKPLAVVMVLHGGGGAGLDVAQPGAHPLSVFRNVADTARILVVYPEGSTDSQGNPGWNDCRNDDQSGAQGDDLSFLQQLMARLSQEMGLTANNMYLTGTSNGALMTFSYAFNFPTTIKAIAVSSGNLPLSPAPGACSNGSTIPLPILLTHGTLDPAMPADGGCVANLGGACNRGRVVSQSATLNYWLQRNNLAIVTPIVTTFNVNTNDAGNVEKRVYTGAFPLVYYVLNGAGHAVPSLSVFSATTAASGAQNRDIEYATEVWKFFTGFQ
ncbi:MAG: alpha/beta hydrolase family esterase [Bacteroidota bacterium]